MKLSPQEIEDIATLARLELSDAEKKMYAEQLSVVLEYMKILDEVDTSNVEETCQVTGLMDVVREDEVVDSGMNTKGKLIESFPEKEGDMLKVQAVFE